MLKWLPYQGPGWYSRVAAEFLLHTHRVTWNDCLLKIDASCHHPPDFLRSTSAEIEEAWTDEHYRKLNVNSLIGTFAIEDNTLYTIRTSSCSDDVVAYANGCEYVKINTEYSPNKVVTDYIFETN